MPVHHIQSEEDFRKTIQDNKVVFIDFYAKWCGPCKMLAPLIESHSKDETYRTIHFTKIDVDELSALSDELKIQAMPTLLLFKDGKQVEEIIDPKPPALVEFLNKGI